jgi:hypothetical protein
VQFWFGYIGPLGHAGLLDAMIAQEDSECKFLGGPMLGAARRAHRENGQNGVESGKGPRSPHPHLCHSEGAARRAEADDYLLSVLLAAWFDGHVFRAHRTITWRI